MSRMKTIRGRNGHEVEVVTRAASKKRQARDSERPLFGGPESVLGERGQKDLDNEVVYAVLGEVLNPQGE